MKLSTLNKGLVAHYPLDIESLRGTDGLTDKTPYSNHGVSANTPVFTTDRMGQSNRAMSFNGTDDLIDLGLDNPSNLTGDITISVWINPKSMGELNGGHIISNGKFSIRILNDQRIYVTNNGFANFSYTVPQAIPVYNTWYHVLVTRTSAGIVKIYINNVDETGGGFAGTPVAGTTNTIIGNNAAGEYTWDGSIADVRIYNRALDQTEITALFQNYRSKISTGNLLKGLVLDLPMTQKWSR